MYFHNKTYTVRSEKIHNGIRCVLISDLHNADYGERYEDIIEEIRAYEPDLILCAGDVLSRLGKLPFQAGVDILKRLRKIAPVYYANGNHESNLRKNLPRTYEKCIRAINKAGVHVLNNRCEDITVNGNPIHICGLELGLGKYVKLHVHHLSEKYLKDRIGAAQNERFNLLIAHNPAFGDLYYRWGADLIVSGHFHGGLIRSPFTGRAMLSPYGFFYPKHGYGQYIWSETGRDFRNTSDRKPAGTHVPVGTNMISSAGLGDHSIPIRIFNPHEIVFINIEGA